MILYFYRPRSLLFKAFIPLSRLLYPLATSRFDRGIIANILEFWRVPGYAVDYYSVFSVPGEPAAFDNAAMNSGLSGSTPGTGSGGLAGAAPSSGGLGRGLGMQSSDRTSPLTQENVMRLSHPPRGDLTASNSGSSVGHPGAQAGPGSGFTVRKNSLNHRHIGSGANIDSQHDAIPSSQHALWFTSAANKQNPIADDKGSSGKGVDGGIQTATNMLVQAGTLGRGAGPLAPSIDMEMEMTRSNPHGDSTDSSEVGDLMV